MNIEFYGRFYTSPPPTIGLMERKCIENLKLHIEQTSNFDCNIIINLTWIEVEKLIPWIKEKIIPGKTKVYFTGFIDGVEWFTNSAPVLFLLKNQCVIEYFGFHIENWYSFLPCVLKKYTDEEIALDNIKNLYVSLNRKPTEHRQKLVSLLIKNNLIDKGHITFQKDYFKIIDDKTGNTEQHLHNEDKRFSRPEDIETLGDLEVWKSSYCIIVSETDSHDPWHLSEKTWKPIMGMRPFILNSHKKTYKILENLNLYTPAALFKNNSLNDADPYTVIEQIKTLYNKTTNELYKLYSDQYDMLSHNKNIFLEMSKGLGLCEGCGKICQL